MSLVQSTDQKETIAFGLKVLSSLFSWQVYVPLVCTQKNDLLKNHIFQKKKNTFSIFYNNMEAK
jgi:hypothetical protein